MIFKTLKKTDTGAMPVYNRINDRTRPRDVRDRIYTTDMKTTPRVSSTVSIWYINRMESNSNKSRWDRM